MKTEMDRMRELAGIPEERPAREQRKPEPPKPEPPQKKLEHKFADGKAPPKPGAAYDSVESAVAHMNKRAKEGWY